MKRTLLTLCLGAGLALIPLAVPAGTAQVRLSNNSVRMSPGDCSCGFGLTWTIRFWSFYTEYPSQANGELAPLPQTAAHTHWSYLVLEDPSTVASATYAELDVPLTEDANGNGTPDFYDVALPVAATSGGTYAVAWAPGYGQLSLTWTRAAGSRFGSCQLSMIDPILGLMGPFNHSFELVEYAGALTYSPGATSVTGSIRLAKNAQPSDLLEGPVVLHKAPTNRFNLLTLTGADWTNEVEVFTFADCQLTRAPAHPTVYQGTLQNLYGAYGSWQLSIVDTNDANGNGIPDLSDDLVATPPRRPVLSLSRTPTHLRLRVSGDLGRTHLVQEAATPDAATWKTVQSLTLTNDPQVLTLPLPTDTPVFWRVQALAILLNRQ